MNMSIIGILFVFTSSFLSEAELKQVRDMYKQAYDSEENATFFAEYLQNSSFKENNLIKGYRASSLFFLSKYGWNPYTKLKKFNDAKNLLESAIENDPLNSELRFLRLAVQENVPAFLMYDDNKEGDKQHLLECLIDMKDQDLKNRIKDFLLNHTELTAAQKKDLQRVG